MNLNNYETVFILTSVLSEQQAKDTAEKFKQILLNNGGEIVNEENWGSRKLAYPINNKGTGYYHLFEFKGPSTIVNSLEIEFKRDERVVRFLTTALDKNAIAYNEKRKSGKFNKKTEVKDEA
jgi:small subunit ribosomal protein S6